MRRMGRAFGRITLLLPEELLEDYLEQAREKGVPLEELLVDRLEGCRRHRAERGLYFDDAERNELERLTGGRILKSARLALERLRALYSVRLAAPETPEEKTGANLRPVTVWLEPRLLTRLKTRADAFRQAFPAFVTRQTVENLERYVGMR